MLADACRVVMIGKWSLYRYGPNLIVAVAASPGDVKVRSIVKALSDKGLTLVPRSVGVMRQALCSWIKASLIERPALLGLVPVSHSPC